MATFRERVKSAWNAFATQGSLEELDYERAFDYRLDYD